MNKSISTIIGVSFLFILILWVPVLTHAQSEKPKVAILVYEGVQIIDHAIPFEVFGQFSLNDVYTVSKDSSPLTTYMGMKIVPNFSFEDAPVPDVLVLPGGDAGTATSDLEIKEWINKMVISAEYVLTICTGIFFLEDNEILKDKNITTWYGRQEELQHAAHHSRVIGDEVTVESGKLISAAGIGINGSLLVLGKLHGSAWAEVVRLNMEYEPIPDSLRTPRIELADLILPDQIYGAFPWRQAELLQYKGDKQEWIMKWRYHNKASIDSLSDKFLDAMKQNPKWELDDQEMNSSAWKSYWNIQHDINDKWYGELSLELLENQVELGIYVNKMELK